MIVSRLQLRLAAAVLFALGGALAWQAWAGARLRAGIARPDMAKSPALLQLEGQLAGETRRLAAAEARISAGLEEVERTRLRPPEMGAAATDKPEAIRAVLTRGAQLVQEGNRAAALEIYANAYREIAAKHPGSPECLRLMNELLTLGRSHRPALVTLAELREAAQARYARTPDPDVAIEVALINEQLGEGHRTLALYDTLARDDGVTRRMLAMIAPEAFVEARRYEDALFGTTFGRMLSLVENAPKTLAQAPAREALVRKTIIEQTITGIEVLTGANRKEDARVLMERLLAFDNSDATRATLQQRVVRASGGQRNASRFDARAETLPSEPR